MDRWQGRVALVTGASAGIGAGICRELVKYMTVVGCARRVKKIQDIAEEDEVKAAPGRLVAIQCDLTKETDILAMFEEIRTRFGRIDVCVNNAGIWKEVSISGGNTEDWSKMFEVNVLALCICTRESLKLMKEKGIDDGQIIQISSIDAHVTTNFDFPGMFYDGALKSMVRALAEGLRRELTSQKSHIRVACISPGLVKGSEMIDRFFADHPEMKTEAFENMKALAPKNIADSIVHILTSPPHVDINDIVVRCVEEN